MQTFVRLPLMPSYDVTGMPNERVAQHRCRGAPPTVVVNWSGMS
jgi:hypothetical protein